MKKIIAVTAAAVLVGSVGVAVAGKFCCPAAKKTSTTAKVEPASKATCGTDFLEGVTLSQEQQDKLAALKEECMKESECSKECFDKYVSGMKNILTDDQLAQVEKSCDDAGWKSPFAATTTASAE